MFLSHLQKLYPCETGEVRWMRLFLGYAKSAGFGCLAAVAVGAFSFGIIVHVFVENRDVKPYYFGYVDLEAEVSEKDFPNSRKSNDGAGIRMDANYRSVTEDRIEKRRKASVRSLVQIADGRVKVSTVDGAVELTSLGKSRAPLLDPSLGVVGFDPLQANLFSPHEKVNTEIPPLLYGEETGRSGLPVRWNWRDGDYLRKEFRQCNMRGETHLAGLKKLIRSAGLPLPGAHYSLHAGKYRDLVIMYSERFNQTASLVLAIMHTESNFNPVAVSPSQALGLMQIVPHAAGNEVYRYLQGQAGTPSREALFTPEHNIKYGTAYLHLLSQRYFSGVKNTASRQMCVIAAYNCGPGAVLRHFDGNQDIAIMRINALSPMQLYNVLTTELPFAETRRYVQVVMSRVRQYSLR